MRLARAHGGAKKSLFFLTTHWKCASCVGCACRFLLVHVLWQKPGCVLIVLTQAMLVTLRVDVTNTG